MFQPDDEVVKLTTKSAVEYLVNHKGLSKYRVAKMLNVDPPRVNSWSKGTRMSYSIAPLFLQVFNIEVTDIYDSRRLS